MRFNRLSLFIFSIFLISCNSQDTHISDLKEGFLNPGDSLNPWCYYYWVANNVTKEGITRDLESMAEAGIGAAFIGNIGTADQYQGDVPMLSEEWFDLTVHAVKEGQRFGVDIGMFNSPGWSQSGGPWNKAENAMRYLTYSETIVDGPGTFNGYLKKPTHNLEHAFHYNLNVESEEDTVYEDIRVLAFPVPLNDQKFIQDDNPSIIGQNIINVSNILDGDIETAASFINLDNPENEVQIEIIPEREFEARTLKIFPEPVPVNMDIELLAEVNGVYKSIRKFNINRSNAMISVGFIPYAPITVSFPAVRSSRYKLICSDFRTRRGGIAEIELTGAAGLEFYQEKTLAKMHQSPLPAWDEYKWETQNEPDNSLLCIESKSVIDITNRLNSDGILTWDVPDGEWLVMRIGMYPTGTKNTPASREATGLEVDKMNKDHVRHHFNSYLKKFIDSIPEDQRKSFKYVIADSYEQGSQNWTDDLDVAFRKKYGYDPIPYLPVLSGRVVESAQKSDRFLWDLRRIIADKIAYEYVGGLSDISHEYGLKVWLENYGHWGFPAEFLQYGGQSDMVAGEFWAEGDLGSIECRAASSVAHIYGKDRVYAESYTSSGKPFERHPGYLKKRGDWSYSHGINHTVLTLFIHQPYQDRFPGIMEWYGSEINRFNTWYTQADSWINYLKRCHYMLQQGSYVADVAYFIGEDVPVMTGKRDPELPDGYSYDYVNAEVLMSAGVKDGRLLLGSGMKYEILVLPDLPTMTPGLLEKIAELLDDGAKILGTAPERSPSLKNYPECDEKVRKLAGVLWDKDQKINTYGKGRVYRDMTLEEVFADLHIIQDFTLDGGDIVWTHRQKEGLDIYFVSNQTGERKNIRPGFRINGRQPELWNAIDGSSRLLPEFTEERKTTFVPLTLEPYQSFFIVFKDEIQAVKGENFPEPIKRNPIEGDWEVQFDPTMRGPEIPVLFPELFDWKDHSNDEIKYFSGTAIYSKDFNLNEIPQGEAYLDLGKVEVMASIKINGRKMGGVWTPPYRVNITGALKEGKNSLEIEVVNLWMNRLIRDRDLPEEDRLTWLSLGHEVIDEDKDLFSSGLLGPVCIDYFW